MEARVHESQRAFVTALIEMIDSRTTFSSNRPPEKFGLSKEELYDATGSPLELWPPGGELEPLIISFVGRQEIQVNPAYRDDFFALTFSVDEIRTDARTVKKMVAHAILLRVQRSQEFTIQGIACQTGIPREFVRQVIGSLVSDDVLTEIHGRYDWKEPKTSDSLRSIVWPLEDEYEMKDVHARRLAAVDQIATAANELRLAVEAILAHGWPAHPTSDTFLQDLKDLEGKWRSCHSIISRHQHRFSQEHDEVFRSFVSKSGAVSMRARRLADAPVHESIRTRWTSINDWSDTKEAYSRVTAICHATLQSTEPEQNDLLEDAVCQPVSEAPPEYHSTPHCDELPAIALVDAAPVDIAILTVLPEEHSEMYTALGPGSHLQGTSGQPNEYAWSLHKIATLTGSQSYRVVLGQTAKPTRAVAQEATRRTIDVFSPSYLLWVGVCGGIGTEDEPVKPGDVVVASHIWGYEYGKIDEKGAVSRLNFNYAVNGPLLSAIRSIRDSWKSRLHHKPSLIVGEMASGDKVIDDEKSAFFSQVLEKLPKIRGIEMEGAGACHAIEASRNRNKVVGFAMIRGVSDVPGSSYSGTQVRDAWKRGASRAAAELSVELIRIRWPQAPLSATKAEGGSSDSSTKDESTASLGLLPKAEGIREPEGQPPEDAATPTPNIIVDLFAVSQRRSQNREHFEITLRNLCPDPLQIESVDYFWSVGVGHISGPESLLRHRRPLAHREETKETFAIDYEKLVREGRRQKIEMPKAVAHSKYRLWIRVTIVSLESGVSRDFTRRVRRIDDPLTFTESEHRLPELNAS